LPQQKWIIAFKASFLKRQFIFVVNFLIVYVFQQTDALVHQFDTSIF
jgi:hypothetical protein